LVADRNGSIEERKRERIWEREEGRVGWKEE
jgi:hypothetical protein